MTLPRISFVAFLLLFFASSALQAASIAAAGYHTCAVTSSGGVVCWGDGHRGVLGEGASTYSDVPVAVTGLASAVTSLTAGEDHTCALTAGGAVFCWGSNQFGQLGNGSSTEGPDGFAAWSPVPVAVVGLGSGVTAIAASSFHTCAVTGEGVKCWGGNWSGQLGNGTTTDSTLPVSVMNLGSGVKDIAVSEEHSCAVTSDGGVWCWGFNVIDYETVYVVEPLEVMGLPGKVSFISASTLLNCAVIEGAAAQCWVYSDPPRALAGLGSEIVALVARNFGETCAVTALGQVLCIRDYSQTPIPVPEIGSGVIAIAMGIEHTCVLTSDGGAKCWGENQSGQLGNGNMNDDPYSSVPVNVIGFGDKDLDGVLDSADNCPSTSNANQLDWDADGKGDKCDDLVPMPDDVASTTGKNGTGKSVAFAGDFNKDGYGDYVIASPGSDLSAKDAGRAEVISGKDGSVLKFINGIASKDAFGFAVTGNADIDNDGYADIVVGAPNAGATRTGSITILYGPDGERTQTISGTVPKSQFGAALALGDADGDKHADIIVGAPKDDDTEHKLNDAGSVTVFSGNDFVKLKTFYGKAAKANAGSSVASGDFDGGGNADIIIGAPNDGGTGTVTVYDLAGAELLKKSGESKKSQFGKAVASGDVDKDGKNDVLVGAPADDDIAKKLKDAGSVTVFFANGNAPVKKTGLVAKANFGNSVAAGDVNDDGYADIIAGAWKDDKPDTKFKDTGSVSVFSGNGYSPIGTKQYGDAAKDYFGAAVSAGDINGDGKADVIIGIPGFDLPGEKKPVKDAGKVTVLSGAGL